MFFLTDGTNQFRAKIIENIRKLPLYFQMEMKIDESESDQNLRSMWLRNEYLTNR